MYTRTGLRLFYMAKDDPEHLTPASSSHVPGIDLCYSVWLTGCWGQTQGFMPARQVVYQLSCTGLIWPVRASLREIKCQSPSTSLLSMHPTCSIFYHRDLLIHAYSCSTHPSKEMEAVQMSVDRGIDNGNTVQSQKGILFGCEEKWNYGICIKMDDLKSIYQGDPNSNKNQTSLICSP